MQRKKRRSLQHRLTFQLATLMGIGVCGFAQAEDYSEYYSSADEVGTKLVAQDCAPCQPGTVYAQDPCLNGQPGVPIMPDGQAPSPDGNVDQPSQTPLPQNNNPAPVSNNSRSLRFANTTSGNFNAPNMVGDFFGGSLTHTSSIYSTIYGNVATSGGDRRFKVGDNSSPIPQDRVFYNYNHFENAVTTIDGRSASVDRSLFGIEKTFLNEMTSLEFRLPFAGALNATQTIGGSNNEATEFGNIGLGFKTILLTGSDCLLSAGATLTLPTGDDYTAYTAPGPGGVAFLSVDNDSVQLAPYLGFFKQCGTECFFQSFVQANFDLNGNDVREGDGTYAGVIQEQNLLFLDASFGRWLCRNNCSGRNRKGVAALAELHYTTTMNDSDTLVVGGTETLTSTAGRIDVLNATGALHLQNGPLTLRVGGTAPLRQEFDKTFDAEFFVQVNRFF